MTSDPAIKAFINEFAGTDDQHLQLARNLTNGNPGGISTTDRQYLSKDAEGSEYEFQVAQLGAEKASNNATQQYAFRLLQDHAMLNADLMQLAHQKGLTLPTSINDRDRSRIENLMQLNGAAFDDAFVAEMVRINSSDIADSQSEVRVTKDPEIQAFLTKFAPTDEEHLRLARSLSGGGTAQR
jgi:putative membrane protein